MKANLNGWVLFSGADAAAIGGEAVAALKAGPDAKACAVAINATTLKKITPNLHRNPGTYQYAIHTSTMCARGPSAEGMWWLDYCEAKGYSLINWQQGYQGEEVRHTGGTYQTVQAILRKTAPGHPAKA